MAPVVIGFLETKRTSLGWHGPQETGAARRSPGFMKRTKSRSSSSRAVYVRSGLADVLKTSVFFGWTCALRWASLNELLPGAPTALTLLFPPWQSVHPRRTLAEACMLLASVAVWQDMQPTLFAS